MGSEKAVLTLGATLLKIWSPLALQYELEKDGSSSAIYILNQSVLRFNCLEQNYFCSS